MIRAVLFDLDETLIDRAETMRKFLYDQYHCFPEPLICDGSYASIDELPQLLQKFR